MITDIDNLAVPELAAYASLTETQLRNRLDPEMGICRGESATVRNARPEDGRDAGSLLSE